MVEPERPQITSQHDAYAFRAGLARLYARMCMHTPTRLGTHMHARTHARTCKHAHTDQYVILIAFLQQQCFRELVLVLRYTYIASPLFFGHSVTKIDKLETSSSGTLKSGEMKEQCTMKGVCIHALIPEDHREISPASTESHLVSVFNHVSCRPRCIAC